MKKLLFIITFMFLLVGCEEIDLNPRIPAPELELKVEGQLDQIFELSEELEDVTFTLILKNFDENEINKEELTIVWKEGETVIEKEDPYTHHVEIRGVYNIEVSVTVTFQFKNKTETLTESRVIKVIELPTQISLDNDIDDSVFITNLIYAEDTNVGFTATITGNLTHTRATWIISKSGAEELRIMVEDLQNELVVENGVGKLMFNYDFIEVGNYTISLEVGKYKSDYQHVSVKYGDFEILFDEEQLIQTENYTDRTLNVTGVSEVLGDGVYHWYLNGELLENQDDEMTIYHTDKDVGGYLYHVEFVPDDASFDIQKTEPVLIVNAIETDTVAGFNSHLENGTKALFIKEDLDFGNEEIKIDYELTIVSDGKALKNERITNFITVTSDNVYFKNIRLEEAKKYILIYSGVKNGYLEDVIFHNPGADGSPTDLSAALYVMESEVIVKNIVLSFSDAMGNTGIRIDSSKDKPNSKNSKLTILGYFHDGEILLPVASGNSLKEKVEVEAVGFVEFVIPLLDAAIRRWSNEQQAIQWILNNPNKVDYEQDDAVDVEGITIDISFGGSLDQEFQGDLGFVYLFLDMFNQFGTLEFLKLDGTPVSRYYIIDYEGGGKFDSEGYEFSGDRLLYALDPTGQVYAKPIVPDEPGEYLVNVSIGDEAFGGALDLGYFHITVYKKASN